MAGFGKFSLDVVDREVFLSHCNGKLPHTVTGGSVLRAMSDILEKGGPLGGIVAELVTKDPESARGIAKLGSSGR